MTGFNSTESALVGSLNHPRSALHGSLSAANPVTLHVGVSRSIA